MGRRPAQGNPGARMRLLAFCVPRGGVWTSNPGSTLAVTIGNAALVSRAQLFGTRTATFHVCSRCGGVPFVTSEIAGHLYAVVNVNVLPSPMRHGFVGPRKLRGRGHRIAACAQKA